MTPATHLLRRLFFLQNIYFRSTPLRIVIIYMFVLVGLMSFLDRLTPDTYWALYLLLAVTAYFLIRTCLRSWIVSRRTQRSSYVTPHFIIGSNISSSVADYELNGVDSTDLLREGDTWKIYDAVFDFHRHTKGGSYLSKQTYYTVFEAKLIRQVPHIIFDSKSAKRSQFKYLYAQSQRLTLEGNFDQSFDTYVPETYQIDSLSFVSPEVMRALLTAANYDIELVGDRLLCYAPLLDIAAIEKLQTTGLSLVAHLNDNLDNYKDDRLAHHDRSTKVSIFGRSLLRSPAKYIPALVLSSVASVVILYFCFTISFEIVANELSLIVICTLFSSLYQIIKINRTNNRLRLANRYATKHVQDKLSNQHTWQYRRRYTARRNNQNI